MTFYATEDDRWVDDYRRKLDRQDEEREAAELARRERLIEKGWPHRPLIATRAVEAAEEHRA